MVLLKNDCEKGAGVDLAKKYKVRMYPTFAMVDRNGEVTDRWAGYDDADSFIKTVDAARADPRTIAAKQAAYSETPTVALALALGQYSAAVSANADAVKYFRKAMELDPSQAPELRKQVFLSMYYGQRSGEFSPEQIVSAGREIADAPDCSADDLLLVAEVTRNFAEPDEYVPILKKALAATADSDDPELQRAWKFLRVDEALLIDHDKDEALRRRRAMMPDDWRDDPDVVNEFAWWCFQNDVNLDEAYDLALKAAEKNDDPTKKANILDTAAEIAFKRGDRDRAVELETRAVALAPGRKGLEKNLERFRGETKQ